MATYNLDQVAGALLLEVIKPQVANRYEKHYNLKAIPGLAIGDIAYADVVVPDWVRTVCVQKRTDTANADVLLVQAQDTQFPINPVLPIKTATSVQTTGSTANTASNTLIMQLYPVGKIIRMQLTIATSVPAQCLLSMCFYDF